ncbi:MAG: undecaprenyl-phosphate glucose phosphotransferase [Chloroflexi bacterium]|nr:MAG: undecaprenyl-phosphate glucose phosphotransferase [Chloroflexota bacterium]
MGKMAQRFRRRILWLTVITDVILINGAFVLAYWMRYRLRLFREVSYDAPFSVYIPFAAGLTLLLLVTFKLDGVYNGPRGVSWFDQMYAIVNSTAKAIILLFAVVFATRPLYYSGLMFLEAGALVVLLLGAGRFVRGEIEARLRKRGIGTERVVIVGAGEVGRAVMRTLVARPELGYQVVGFVDDNPERGRKKIGRFRGLGDLENLARVIEDEKVDVVIITLPWMYHRKIMTIVRECERKQVQARIVPDLFQMSLSQVDVDDLGGIPLIGVREPVIGRWQERFKRAMDVVLASLALLVLSPLMGLIALLIRLDSPGPALFRQVRVGKNGRRFVIYKFRSMHIGAEAERRRLAALNEADGPLFKIRDDPRRTRVGRWLRRTSLDELPQLFNVLRGEMSLVGPRPPLPEEVRQYQEWHKRRLEVRPGITGLWQVSGRSELTFDEMCLLDIYYIEHWSPALDVKILLRTIPKILTGDGAY